MSASTYRRQFLRIVGTASVILVPITAAQVVLDDIVRHAQPSTLTGQVLLTVVVFVFGGFGISASTFYAGVVDRTIGAVREGVPERRVLDIVRNLPFRRLVAADLLFAVLVAVGTLALVVPGLVLATLFGVVGPVLLIEDLGVIASFRRSYRLVRPHFFRAMMTLLVPLFAESLIADGLFAVLGHNSLLAQLVVECSLAALVASAVSVVEVETAYELLLHERAVGGYAADPSA